MVKLKMKFNKRNSNISKDVISKVVFVFDKFEIIFYALCLCGIFSLVKQFNDDRTKLINLDEFNKICWVSYPYKKMSFLNYFKSLVEM